MNKKQLSEHIGNIDDRLVQQAESIPNYAKQRRHKRLKQLLSMAAVLILMISSFSLGAIAFAREMPAAQEILELEGLNFKLILPDSWAGQYLVEKNVGPQDYIVYSPKVREAASKSFGMADGGVLFYIACFDESMTEEQFVENGLDITGYRYILATSDKTYILYYTSDVQCDPGDEDQVRILVKMESEIRDIQFVVSNIFDE